MRVSHRLLLARLAPIAVVAATVAAAPSAGAAPPQPSPAARPAAAPNEPPAPPPQLKLDVRRAKLPNGLRVVLAVDHTSPTVAVDVMYDVGARNEERGH